MSPAVAASPDPQELIRDFRDHRLWAEEALPVREKSGKLIDYVLQPAQIRLNQAIDDAKRLKRPIRIIFLKARQVMVSTGTAAHIYQRTAFSPGGHHALIVAHQKDAVANIFSYYETFHDHYRGFRGAMPNPEKRPTQGGRGSRLAFVGDSWIDVATANNIKAGRSFTLRSLHLSEFGFYRDAATLMTGLMQAIPKDPDTMVVVESTANGVGNDFHKLWELANDPARESDWVALFFAWYEHPEYRLELRVPPEQFESSLNKEEAELMKRYTLTLEQMHWRRWTINTTCQGDIERFRQEYPSYAEEAFRASGRPRFSFADLERMPIIEGAPVGSLRELQLGPNKVIQLDTRERGETTIYQRPINHHLYTVGADTAEGIDAAAAGGTSDPDYSSGCVFDIDSGEQVAKLRARMEPAEFGRQLVTLGKFYNWAFLVIESNGPGLATIEEVLRLEYPPHLLYHRQGSPEDLTKTRGGGLQRVGWRTTTVTRPQLIHKLDRAIREMAIWIHDPHTIQECRTFVIKPSGKPEAQNGCHDDDVLAAALGVVGIESFPSSAREQTETYKVNRYPPLGERRGRRSRVN